MFPSNSDQSKSFYSFFLLSGGCVLLLLMILLSNKALDKIDPQRRIVPSMNVETENVQVLDVKDSSPKIADQQSAPEESNPDEVICKSQVIRGVDIVENVCYKGRQEIFHQTMSKDKVLEQTGQIPEGVVKFYDSYNNVHGEQEYREGKKVGTTKTFFEDGHLKSETKYNEGKLQWVKEYFDNGILRSEVDYREAIMDPDQNSEVGVGKLYSFDGTLKYEWNLSRGNSQGFKKSYNKDGSLRAATYFDSFGHEIKPSGFPAQ